MKDTLDVNSLVDSEIAAKLLDCSPKTLGKMRRGEHQDPGPDFVKIGRLVKYRVRAIYQYIDQRTAKAAS
jgi:hypothetical protein